MFNNINYENTLLDSLRTGFINKSSSSKEDYRPSFLVNDPKRKLKVLTTVESELKKSDFFWFSVAFVTSSGVAVLINTLEELRQRGVRGKILVSKYLNFSQPEALKKLLQFENIELRIMEEDNYHGKGYIFRYNFTGKKSYNIIIGSSNLTANALCCNREWNLKVSASENSQLVERTLEEFELVFSKATPVNHEFIEKYSREYSFKKNFISPSEVRENDFAYGIEPNLMQREALANLENLIAAKKRRALLISATGTGKTYLSALHVRNFKPKKLLFVVHREKIATAALESFKKILGDERSYGVYSGENRNLEADFIFATIQTLSKDEHLLKFAKKHFDYIVIDETHRAGAATYQKLMEYFEPKFLLGMTATPERTDGYDIFKAFDYNIAYEIRLQQALEEEMLSPFHYYGITDITLDDTCDKSLINFSDLVSEARVHHIIEKIKFYGSDTGEIRGLIFCSRKEECKTLSEKFNALGYRSIYLTGDSSPEERGRAMNNLESDEPDRIQYIFTVDIFNEGIDIPKINQVIFLRATESSIIFIQQLGRGLRKSQGKEYLTVLDFIGNYQNNYLIPVALFGDNSYNKDNLRALMIEGNSSIPGSSTINFDEISRKKIFESISVAKLNPKRELVEEYNLLKFRLGYPPMMMDFVNNNSRDPYNFVNSYGSYYAFQTSVENQLLNFNFESEKLSDEQVKKILKLFSLNIGNGKRVHELVVLQKILSNYERGVDSAPLQEIRSFLQERYGGIVQIDMETVTSVIRNLNFDFMRIHHDFIRFDDVLETFIIDSELKSLLKSEIFRKYLIDLLNYGKYIFDKNFSPENYLDGFLILGKYSRKDVARILNWSSNEEGTMNGYVVKDRSMPIFVNYHKDEGVSENIDYHDYFVDRSTFEWMTRSGRRNDSNEIKKIRNNIKNPDYRFLFFVKKHNSEGNEYIYLGDISPEIPLDENFEESLFRESYLKNGKSVVHITFRLKREVDENIYNYITTDI